MTLLRRQHSSEIKEAKKIWQKSEPRAAREHVRYLLVGRVQKDLAHSSGAFFGHFLYSALLAAQWYLYLYGTQHYQQLLSPLIAWLAYFTHQRAESWNLQHHHCKVLYR